MKENLIEKIVEKYLLGEDGKTTGNGEGNGSGEGNGDGKYSCLGIRSTVLTSSEVGVIGGSGGYNFDWRNDNGDGRGEGD